MMQAFTIALIFAFAFYSSHSMAKPTHSRKQDSLELLNIPKPNNSEMNSFNSLQLSSSWELKVTQENLSSEDQESGSHSLRQILTRYLRLKQNQSVTNRDIHSQSDDEISQPELYQEGATDSALNHRQKRSTFGQTDWDKCCPT